MRKWKVTLEIISTMKPTELAIMVNMFPGVVDALIVKSEKMQDDATNEPPSQ